MATYKNFFYLKIIIFWGHFNENLKVPVKSHKGATEPLTANSYSRVNSLNSKVHNSTNDCFFFFFFFQCMSILETEVSEGKQVIRLAGSQLRAMSGF